jgi:hypothetical protein
MLATDSAIEICDTVSERFRLAAARLHEQQLDLYGARGGTIVSDLADVAARINHCRRRAVIREHVSKSTGEVMRRDILEMRSCGAHKYCPICSDVQYSRRVAHIASVLIDVPQPYCYLLTFTQKTQTNAADASRDIMAKFRAWIRAGQKRADGSRDNCESAKITGAIKSLEIKMGRDGKFHAHIHAVVFCSEELDFRVYDADKKKECTRYSEQYPQGERYARFREHAEKIGAYLNLSKTSKLTEEWQRITGVMGLDCRPVPMPENFSQGVDLADDKSALGKIRYALKYSVKPGDIKQISDVELFDLFDSMRGVRTVEYLGIFRNRPEPAAPAELPDDCERIYTQQDKKSGEDVEWQPAPEEQKLYEEHAEEMQELRSRSAQYVGNYRRCRTQIKAAYQAGEISTATAATLAIRARETLRDCMMRCRETRNLIAAGCGWERPQRQYTYYQEEGSWWQN